MPEHVLVQEAYDSLGPWARADESGDLLAYVRALVEPLAVVDDVARDTDTHIGWGTLLDIDATPSWALCWLAQFVGISCLQSLSDENQRLRIKEASGFQRGTPAAVIGAARQYLTGTRRVVLTERDGSPWRFRVQTQLSETPDPPLVKAAIEAVKPAGMILVYEVQAGIDIDTMTGTIDSHAPTIDSFSVVVPS